MLTIFIFSQISIPLNNLQGKHIKFRDPAHLKIESEEGQELALVESVDPHYTLQVSIHPHLNFDQFQKVRDHILRMNEKVNGQIDDSRAMLGYLKSGEAAHLFRNWTQWKRLLLEAKLRTLEGQKVRALDEGGRELGSGILVSYEFTEQEEDIVVTSCTLITSFGEKSFSEAPIKIEPTNEW